MKLIAVMFSIFFSFSSHSNEALIFDKGVNVFDEIVSRWEDFQSTTFDTEAMGNTVLAGRCYSKYLKKPNGSAIVFEQLKVDNGPIGTPNDYVTFGQKLYSIYDNHFDQLNYVNYKFLVTSGDIRENLTEFATDNRQVFLNEYSIRQWGGHYYGVSFQSDGGGGQEIGEACYYFLNNN